MSITCNQVLIECKLHDRNIQFELDSGSRVSTIKYCDALLIGSNIVPTKYEIVGYSGNTIYLVGEICVSITYSGKRFRHTFLVVRSSSVNLFAEIQ